MTDFERFVCTTGGDVEAEIAERRREFFSRVLAEHQILPTLPWVEEHTHGMGPKDSTEERLTDEFISTLIIHDETIALVLDRRTDLNMHEVTFYSREPSEQWLAWRDEILQLQAPD